MMHVVKIFILVVEFIFNFYKLLYSCRSKEAACLSLSYISVFQIIS